MAEYRSTLQEGTREDVVSSSASPFFVQSPSNRAKVNVGTSSSVPLFDDTDSPASGDTVPGQLDGVVSNFDINRHPLSLPAFLLGLKWAGYLEPLDTSRNKIKQRYNHFLDKEQFKLNLAAFLENAGVEKLGESMVRFVGAEEPHSPYVGVYIKSAIQSTEAVKIYAALEPSSNVAVPSNPTSINPSSTQWTFLLAADGNIRCEWSCKAKRFWPVRVRFEGPANSQLVPLPLVPSAPPARPRGKRRDTFQYEIDLDDELKKRERKEEEEAFEEKQRLKLNTTKNSARPSNSPAILIDTKNTAPVEPPLEEKPLKTPTTPTVLESAKQLGQSIVASLPPSMQQLPTVMQNGLKQWFDRPEMSGGGADFDEEYDSEEERRRREKRRRRRERRRREEAELMARAKGDRMETDEGEFERLAQTEERRRRRAAGERE